MVYYILQLSLTIARSFKSQIKHIIPITNKTFNLDFVMQSTSLIKPSIMNSCYRRLEGLMKTVVVV